VCTFLCFFVCLSSVLSSILSPSPVPSPPPLFFFFFFISRFFFFTTSTSFARCSLFPLSLFILISIVLHIPQVLSAVVICFNFPGWNNSVFLNFTADLISRIYLRQITMWNHVDLLAINPAFATSGLNLNQAIQPVGRSDRASTTYEITDYLVRFGTTGVWPSTVPSRTVNWVSGVATQGDGGPLANYVQATTYSIGYAKKRTAASRTVGLGALKGRFNTFVPPTDTAIQSAALTSSLPLPAQDTWSDMSMGTQTTSAGAYPATHFSFFIVLPYRNSAGALNWPDDTAG
jgi:ABC-type phosphate transport system substrate-binding protein